MTRLIFNPNYTSDTGEIIDSFLVNSDGLILEYARIQTADGINTVLVASEQLQYGEPKNSVS